LEFRSQVSEFRILDVWRGSPSMNIVRDALLTPEF
jgi:hypothetical protein